jgi:hypothetical protein
VLVDVGTGFFVEKSTADAVKFYSDKIDDLSQNLADIEKVVAGKNDNLKVVEDGEFGFSFAEPMFFLHEVKVRFLLTSDVFLFSCSFTPENVDRGAGWWPEAWSVGTGQRWVGYWTSVPDLYYRHYSLEKNYSMCQSMTMKAKLILSCAFHD